MEKDPSTPPHFWGKYSYRKILHIVVRGVNCIALSAYKKASLKTHPDKTYKADASLFIEVRGAYTFILGELNPDESASERMSRRVDNIKRGYQFIQSELKITSEEMNKIKQQQVQFGQRMDAVEQRMQTLGIPI